MHLNSVSSSSRGDASRQSLRRATLAILPFANYDPFNSYHELKDLKEQKEPKEQNDRPVSPHDDDPNPNARPSHKPARRPGPEIEPDTLTKDTKAKVFHTVFDVFLCILAASLLVKTTLVIFAWMKDRVWRGADLDKVSRMTLNLIDLNDEAVTGFTIIFVTIMTTLTKRYALYKAQEGAYIADLEQLQASMSLPSTIKAIFSLKRFTKASLILITLWCFYYLGSQADKREYTLVSSGPFSNLSIAVPTSDIVTFLERPEKSSSAIASMTVTDANFISALAYKGPSRPGIDAFGDLLLPDPGLLLPNGSVSPDGITARIQPSSSKFLSFVGRPLWTRSNEDKSSPWYKSRIVGSYSVQVSYFKVNCVNITTTSLDQFPANVVDSMNLSLNMTNSSTADQLVIWQRWHTSVRENGSIAAANDSTAVATKIACDIVEPAVQISVHCELALCKIWKVFYPYIPLEQLYSTRFQRSSEWAHEFFSNMLLSEGTPVSRNHSTLVQDMLGLRSTAVGEESTAEALLQQYSEACTTLINSYFNALLINIVPEDGHVTPEDGYATPITSSGALYRPHYQIFWEWIIMDYISGLILLAASIFSFWIRKHTLAPDVFGYVSTLTRDNPHFPVPSGGSTLDGIERTRRLGNIKVKIGDVEVGQDGVGRLGFVPVRPTLETGELRKDKRYV